MFVVSGNGPLKTGRLATPSSCAHAPELRAATNGSDIKDQSDFVDIVFSSQIMGRITQITLSLDICDEAHSVR
jgi:hypothetical protein